MSKIIIIGRGGSGKDYLRQKFTNSGFKNGVLCTTRPKRNNEVHGVDYYYYSDKYFYEKNKNSEFVFVEHYRDWKYGLTIEEFNKSNVLILTPSALSKLTLEQRQNSLVIFLDIPENILIERLINRQDSDSVERRLISDRLDFENFNDFDIKITNPNF